MTVFVTEPATFTTIHQAVRYYELATWAQLKPPKSKALAIGKWKEPATILGIEIHERVGILGVIFGPTIAHSKKDSRTGVICAVRAQGRKAYARNLCLALRIQYLQLFFLAKIWYVAQLFPPTRLHVQQFTTIYTWFIWQGETFRFPVTTLQRPKDEGVWALANIEVKRKTLLYNRLWMLGAREGFVTSELMRTWELTSTLANPPHANPISYKLEYLRQYGIDLAYVTPCITVQSMNKFKCCIYGMLLRTANTGGRTTELRVVRKYPGIHWESVWKNLHAISVSDTIRST
jgi:hypothetical protein